MAEVKALLDKYGILREAWNTLPDDRHRLQLLEGLAELENVESYRTLQFPVTRFHRAKGVKQTVYRADVDKISGWRLHLQFDHDGTLCLKDLIPGSKHDDVTKVVKAKKHRYE